MAYTVMSTQVTGYVVTASDWNEIVNNFIAGVPDIFTTDGDIAIADASNSAVRLAAFTSSTGQLKHERGGIEIDISGVATGGVLAGASAGVWAIVTTGTDALINTGTDTTARLWSAANLKAGIDTHATGAKKWQFMLYGGLP